MTQDNLDKITDKVFREIKSGQVKMRPKWHFVSSFILILLASVLALFLMVFFFSFIVFMLQRTGVRYFPLYGIWGIKNFLATFPWMILLLALAMFLLFEFFVKKFAFSYRKPVLYSLGIAVVATVFLSVVAAGLHAKFRVFVKNRNLPVFFPLYDNYERGLTHNVYFGQVSDVIPGGIMIFSKDGQTHQVMFFDGTRMDTGGDLVVGEKVMIAGQADGGIVRAFGVREARDLPDDLPPPPKVKGMIWMQK